MLSFWKRTILLMLTFALIVGWMALKGQASSPLSPQDLVSSMRRRFEGLNDYQCETINTKYKVVPPKVESHNFFFKKPRLIRLEVTGGKDKGAIAVYNHKGKVRAKAGGILGIFTITMEPNDKRLQDKDGSTFVDSHFGGTIKDLEKLITEGSATVTEVDRGRHYYQLQVEREGRRDIILIDSELLLPIEWLAIRDGKPSSKTEWKSLRINIGLKDSLFEM
jgi:outer membrane lipoprotein-sorting protein